MLFGFGEIALHQVGFAEVFVRAAVPRIEPQRLLIMSHRWIDLPQTAIGVTKIVLNIGIAGVAEPCRRECIDGAIPVAGDDRAYRLRNPDRAPPNQAFPSSPTWSSRSATLRPG